MFSTPTNNRSAAAVTPSHNLSLKLTPSPFTRAPKSPNKPRPFEADLCLKKIIGNTVASPNGFDSVQRTFAYTAGAAAVVITVQDDGSFSQRFFRARPTAVPAPTPPANTSLRESSPHQSASNTWTVDWSDSPSSKTWSSRERIKAATCLSISRDGRFLAVGETGYSPRVLVFSLQDSSSDNPLEILPDHTFGVRSIAFSPDGKFLASLGSANDGFLYVWSFDKRTGGCKLHSSNRCTSVIRGMAWIGNNRLVTVGTRHIKVWRVESAPLISPSKQRFTIENTPQPVSAVTIRTLPGRNCLLGPLADVTFTAIVPITDGNAIVCSEKGDICLLDDSEGGQKVSRLLNAGFSINCAATDDERRLLRVGGRNRGTKVYEMRSILDQCSPDLPPEPSGYASPTLSVGNTCAMGFIDDYWVEADTQHAITAVKYDRTPTIALEMTKEEYPRLDLDQLASHSDAVQGVSTLTQPNSFNASFYTYSSSGTILFWNLEGRKVDSLQVELEQVGSGDEEWTNSCTICVASKNVEFFAIGDRYGVLKIIDASSRGCVFSTKAHGSEILDIALHEEGQRILLATCGRDRTAQLYRQIDRQFVLTQTLDEHTASVCGAMFVENGEKLVTCSADRTINVRQIMTKEVGGQNVMAAITARIITLKTSPVSMTVSAETPQTFLVSLMDRTVATYEISSGRLISSFRATDQDSGDAVVMDSLVMGKPSTLISRPTILAGISSTDKSIRVYDGASGLFVDREWGHTASVTAVALFEANDPEKATLISTGSDGTIMLWELVSRSNDDLEDGEGTSPSREVPFTSKPLRRVLSKAELAEFRGPSPSTTPTGRGSPPRQIRRKTSKFNMSNSTPKSNFSTLPTLNASNHSSPAEEADQRRDSNRNRSPSPPSPRARDTRRPSVASTESRVRGKSSTRGSEFGSLNMATEQVCRTLRAYRKKIKSSESVREDLLVELDGELRRTIEALGEKSVEGKAISETVLTGILDQYSDKLVSMLDQKLRLSLNPNLFNGDLTPSEASNIPPIITERQGSPSSTDSTAAERTPIDSDTFPAVTTVTTDYQMEAPGVIETSTRITSEQEA